MAIRYPFVCLFLLLHFSAFGQLNFSVSAPSTAVQCSSSTIVCSSLTYLGSGIQLQMQSQSSNSVTLRLSKCSPGNFTTSGTAYIKSTSACGTVLYSSSYGTSQSYLDFIVPISSAGVYNYVGVTVTSGTPTNRYYTGTVQITTTTPAPTLTVTSPTTSQSVSCGSFLTVNWNTTNLSSSATMAIEIVHPSTNVPQHVITNSTPNSGTYTWYIPNNFSLPNGNYKIKVYQVGSGIPNNTSGIFSYGCVPPSLSVTTPVASQSVSCGSFLNINWNSINLSSSATIAIEMVDAATGTPQYVINNGVPNSGNYTWYVPLSFSLTNGNYKIKIYQVGSGVPNSTSATFNYNCNPSLTLSSPSLNQNVSCGSPLNIQWSSNALSPSANLAIELVNAITNNTLQVISNGTPNAGSYTWNISANSSLPNGVYKIKLYQVGSGSPNTLSNNFNYTCATSNCVSWITAPPTDTLTFNAANYLCNQQVIQSSQNQTENIHAIKRQDLAKIVYLGLLGNNAITPADSFTSMFYDLQDPNVPYYKWAKALSFLEYGDGISPFSRVFAHFRPGDSILRKDAMKVFAEAWNLPLNTSGPSPFSDVSTSDPMYPWIKTMHANGIVQGNGNSFFPNNYLTRNDAFIILYRMLTQLTKPVPQNSDYYRPFNLTPKNSNRILSLAEGNFSNYTKTSFAINGLMPLSFEHSYNAAATELPDEYFERSTMLNGTVYNQEVLSKGWSHNYNTYIVPILGDPASNTSDDRILVHWGNGETALFKYAGVGLPYISDALGNYDELIVSGGQYVLTTKNQVKYYFQPMIVNGNSFIAPLVKIKDRNNNETNLSWSLYTTGNNNAPRLNSVTDPSGRTLSFAYTNAAFPYRITSVTATAGSIVRSINFGYNTAGQLTSYTDPKSQVTSYNYINSGVNKGLLTTITSPKGNTIHNTYQNRKMQSMKMNGNALEVQTNPVNSFINGTATTQATTTVSRNGQTLTTHASYNENGRVTTIQAPGVNMSAQYNDVNNPTLATTISNLLTAVSGGMSYDGRGNLLSVTKTSGSQTITESYTYNALNDVTTHTDGRNNTTSFGYTNGNLTSIQQPIGTTTMAYNANGTVASITNPTNITTTYGYNTYGNVTSTTLAGMITSSAVYDDASRMTSSTDPKGVSSTFSYDANDNRLSDHLDPAGLSINTGYAFDLNDNLASITNALNGITSLTYDSTDLMTQQSFGGFNKQFEYNEDGTLKKFTSQNNVAFNYTYNIDGQLTNDGYATYTYNADKTLNSVTAGTKTLTYSYDGFKRVTSVTYNDFTGDAVSYQYDNNNNITQITYPNNAFTAKYDYDANNRLTTVKDVNNNVLASYAYLADGRLSSQTNANGTVTNYTYDAAGRMTGLNTVNSNNNIIAGYTFALDNNGNHTQETANIPNGLSLPALGSMMVGGSYANNRVQQYAGTSFTHDGNGNNLTAGTQYSYVWDTKDNLTSYTNSSNITSFEYDPTEARRKKNNTRFVLDPLNNNNVLMETDNAGNPTAIYVHALGLVCRITPGTGAKHFYHYDYRGSTVAITDNSQAVTHRYLYGAFGEDYGVQETGFSNPFRYVGKYGVMYEDSMLYFMRARYYNPKLGRFLGEDPVWGTNLMAYCGNNPVGYVDPNGTFWKEVFVGVAVGAVVVAAVVYGAPAIAVALGGSLVVSSTVSAGTAVAIGAVVGGAAGAVAGGINETRRAINQFGK